MPLSDKQDDHHLRPRSRGGRRKRNIVVLPVDFHQWWHWMFGNMTIDEVHTFIDTVMTPDTRWSHKELEALRASLMKDSRRRGRG